MRTNRDDGFTIVEITVAMALMALGGIALMTAGNYFVKARLTSDSKSAHTTLRNLVQVTLSQKTKVCPGGPATCKTVNQCGNNLKTKDGSAVVIPALANPNDPITPAENVELSITQGNTPIVTSGMDRDRMKFDVLLTGKRKSNTPDGSTLYSGSVRIVGKRTFFSDEAGLTAEVPIDFTVDSGRKVIDCTTRPTEQVIVGGKNDVNSCLDAGGMNVSTSIGTLCRFSSTPSLTDISGDDVCPDGFIGDPATGCTLDMTADSPLLSTIPPCPKGAPADSGCSSGSYLSGGKCVACATPSVPGGVGVTYTSGGDRSAPTDCAVASIASCAAGMKNVGNTCLPTDCNLSASLSATSPTGLSPNSGSVTINFSGVKPGTTVWLMPGPTASVTPSLPATASISPNGGSFSATTSSFTYSNLPQGNYTITVKDPNVAGCEITFQQTFRLDGFYPDPVKNQGSLYCNYQGYPNGIPAPPCPDDPEWDPADPRLGWEDLIPWDPSTNLRACRYRFQCDSPDKITYLPPPIGDGKTPSCYRQITSCPNTDPPSSPGPWKQTSSSPLTCVFNKAAPLPPPPLKCSNFPGFHDIPASTVYANPDLKQWMVTTPAVPAVKKFVGTRLRTVTPGSPAIERILCM